jgi:thioredoxin 1
MPTNSVKKVTDTSFKKDVVDAPHRVAVVFDAPWCGDCLKREILEKIPLPYEMRLAIMDVDRSPRTVKRYDIRGIPLVMLFEGSGNREPIATRAEPMNAEQLIEFLGEYSP